MSTDWSEERLSPLEKIPLVKTMISVPEAAELLGFDVTAGDKIHSPWNPDEKTPSCHLYEDHFYDYSTGQAGDVIDLVCVIGQCTWVDAVRQLWTRSLRSGREPGDLEKAEPRQLEDFIDRLPSATFFDAESDWAKLLPEVDFNAVVGYRYAFPVSTDELLIPHWHMADGVLRCHGVKVRSRTSGKSAWTGSQFTHRLYTMGFGPAVVYDTCIILEGESDAWTVWSQPDVGVDVFALPSGAGAWKDHWLEQLEPYKRVIICFDNDKAGQDARDKVTRKIGWDRVEHLTVPQLFNDVREAVGKGWDVKAAIEAKL